MKERNVAAGKGIYTIGERSLNARGFGFAIARTTKALTGAALELKPPPWQVFPHQARVSDTPSLSNTTTQIK